MSFSFNLRRYIEAAIYELAQKATEAEHTKDDTNRDATVETIAADFEVLKENTEDARTEKDKQEAGRCGLTAD